MREIRLLPIAQNDLESAVMYTRFVLKAPKAARNLHESIIGCLEQVAELPEIGKVYDKPQLETEPIRQILVEKYRVFYTFNETELTVLRIFHTRQDIDEFSLDNF